MKNKVFDYLIRNYWDLLSKEEKEYILANIKTQSIKNILSDENIAFQNLVVVRLISDYKDIIYMNYCPICGELARTVKSRSASCGHTWYIRDN